MNTINLLISQFHFLRPWWLLALTPVVIIAVLLWFQKHNARQWQQMVAPELLQFLLDGQTTRIKPWQFLALLFAWTLSCVALSGPTWEKRPVAVEQNQQALVVILDLSPSMMSEDLKPSRLVRARLKIADLLRLRKDGQTALLVYAGDVHVVTPLTDDTETINNIIPALHPNIMPAQGSNTEAAIARAIKLIKDAAITQGDLLLITDGLDSDALRNVAEIMNRETVFRLSILGVGGTSPTPIPSSKGGFVRDNQRNIITTQLNAGELQSLAQSARGRYRTLTGTSSDIDYLMDLPEPQMLETQKVDRDFDSWYDRGHWVVLLVLPFILYCFRRGVLLSLFLVPLFALSPNKSYAFGWNDLWENKNQQAYEKLEQQQATEAAQQFDNPEWKASAQYRAGNFEEAAKNFAQFDSAKAKYNRGNALAKANKLPEAIKAYDEALKLDANLEDAKTNKKLVEDLLKQQKENQQKQDNNQQDQNKQDQESQDKDKQDQDSKDQQDQDSKDQQNQDQENKNQQDKDQQNKDQKQDQQQSENKEQNSQNQKQQDQQNQQRSDQEQQEQEDKEKTEQQEKSEEQKATEAAQQEAEERDEQERQAAEKEQQVPMGEPTEDKLTDEERQAMEQWLRRVPDDPGGLLRNKFNYEHYKRNQEIMNGDWDAPENGAENRW
jgi:Ca-activated chloride channel homolog